MGSGDDCVLVSDSTKDSYENLGALFANCQPVDKDLMHSMSVPVIAIGPFEYAEGTKMGTCRLDIKNKLDWMLTGLYF